MMVEKKRKNMLPYLDVINTYVYILLFGVLIEITLKLMKISIDVMIFWLGPEKSYIMWVRVQKGIPVFSFIDGSFPVAFTLSFPLDWPLSDRIQSPLYSLLQDK